MPLTTNFNVDPYYDDFDSDKNYYRTLFKPGQAVQSRELTQIQTNLQDQIKKFGDHIFKTGSVVTGGQITVQNCNYLNISSTYSGSDITANNFNQKIIVNSDGSKRAYVLKAYSANEARGEPITFIITQSYGSDFTEDEEIFTSNSDTTAITYYANTASTNAFGNSQSFSVDTGVFYYGGFFVQNQPQSIAVDKYSANGNALIGFVVSEDIVDYTEDTTLLDPAQSASNYQAPGADRYKIDLTLDNRAIDSTDLTKFIELAEFSGGTLQKIIQTPIYSNLGDELARRTYDESGDYVITNFEIALSDNENSAANANVSLGAGKAYIRGYDFKTIAPTTLVIPKPRDTATIINQRITSDYGYFLYANDYFGNFATNQYDNVAILAIDTGSIPYTSTGVINTSILSNVTVGTAKVKLGKFYAASGNTQDSNNYIYKIYVTDVNTLSIGANSGYGLNVSGGSKSTIILPPNFSTNNSVYKGMSIRFVGGPTDPADNSTRVITDSFYNSVGSLSGATLVGSSGQLGFSSVENQRIYGGQSITVSGSEVGSQIIPTVTSNGSTGLTLASVVITGTAGQFSCTARSSDGLFVGQKLTITGAYGGTGGITGYSSPKTYRISATNGTTTFTLVDDATGAAIVTSAGTPTGLTYTLQGAAGSFFCAPPPVPLAVGQVVTINGNPPSGTSGSITGYTGVATNYYITSTDGTRNFTLSSTPGGTAITAASGPLTGLTFNFAGRIIGYSNPTTYLVDSTNGTTSASIIADKVETIKLSSVQITGTSGQISFDALAKAPKVGDVIVISGTFGGTGSISGYANPTTYYVIGTPSSTTAQLSATPGGGAVTSTAGTPSGLTYILTTGAVITVPGPNPGFTYATATGLIAQIDPAFSTAPTTNWRSIIDTSIESAESLLRMNATNHRAASANISPMNKNQNIGLNSVNVNQPLFQPVSIQERRKEPLLIKVGEMNVADNTISDFSYSYQKLWQGVVFTGTTSSSLSYGTGESLQAAPTEASIRQYYRVVVSDPAGSSVYYRGQTIPSDRIVVDTTARTITVSQATTGMVVNVFATINSSIPTSKTKEYIPANVTLVDPAGGSANNIFGNNAVYVSSLDGQTIISENFLEKRAGVPQYLFASDLHSVNAILDFSGGTISTANYEAGAYINVTARYSFDTGQKDSYYDWGSITLKAGQNAPRGPLLVRYNRFKSSSAGYFDVDSYTRLGSQQNGGRGLDYGEIPNYVSQDGFIYKLSDYLDFRPVRRDANSLGQTDRYTANNFVLDADEANIGTKISEPDLDIITDYSYYLPRIDRVVLTKNREFKVLYGASTPNPVPPIEPDDAMTLYVLKYPAYLYYTSSTQIDIYNNRRYTMRDIAKLDKRIQNLEIYTSLSISELAAINKNDRTVRDANGLNRPKNGIFVDSLTDKTGSDITNPDYTAAIDIINRLCRGSYNLTSTGIVSNDTTNNRNVEFNGPLLMLSSTNTPFVLQDKASKTLNVNPFNVVNYLGTITLDPPSDVWKSENRLEAQNIDLTGGDAARDAWSSIQSTSYGSWNTQWTSSLSVDESTSTSVGQRQSRWNGKDETSGRSAVVNDTTTTTTTRVSLTQNLQASRTGILSQIVPQQLTKSFGDRVLDLTVVHYMRQKNILVVAEKFKPATALHAFFDTTKVDNYITVLNSFDFDATTLDFKTTFSDHENVNLYAATSNTEYKATDTLIGVAGIVHTASNKGYILYLPDTFLTFGTWSALSNKGIWFVGQTTGKQYRATGWYHNSGRAKGGTSISPSIKTITLDYSAAGALNGLTTSSYLGQSIRIIKNTGAGQSGTITAYEPSTRVATVSGFTVTPDVTSEYSIGLVQTNSNGSTAAVFNCPDGVFRTGEKLFRLIDNEVGNIENSRTNGDASFYASGIVQTKQETSVSVFVPTVTRRSITESFSASSTASGQGSASVTKTTLDHYNDPLAQTFFVNYSQYPQGIVIDSIRVCFSTKDATEPVTCQIRPTRNGFPASNEIFPYGSKTLTPDRVNVTLQPNISDSTKYTEFKFDVPVLLMPGEHSFVLLSNSTGYNAWIAGIDDTDVVTNVKISEQPYTGSLFLSQNGFTWTPDQQNDMMFSVQKRVFTNDIGYAYMNVDMTENTANVVYDTLQVMSTDAVVANTSIAYQFISELESGGQHTLLPIVPNEDYEVDVDNYGRRILNTVTGNSTFELRVVMASTNRDISPMVDINRLNLLTIENRINNLPLKNTGIQITNSGSGYSGNAKVTIGSGGDGSANAYANVTSAGIIDKIVIDNPGSGYVKSPTITIAAPGSGTTATAVYNGEDKALGGNSDVRYLTKRIPLATGFDAGDLRVYMDLYRPPGTGVLVWYKVMSESDPSRFDDNNWMLMTELSDSKNNYSKNRDDYFESIFAPGEQDSGVPANKIRYTSAAGTGPHKDFGMFQIKVVMYSSDTVSVPKFGQLRVIALPETTLVGTIIPKS